MSVTNKLVIFDFDGVLVDTEYTTFAYYAKILPKHGIELSEEDFQYKIGRKSVDFFKSVMKEKFDAALVEKLVQQKRKAFLQDITAYVKPIPGAFDLVKECFETGLLLAIGSQNERELLDAAVDIFGIRKYFKIISSLQDIRSKKPHPEIFLNIAAKLHIDPTQAVVIEDAVDGVQAAYTGGFKIVGVTTSAQPEDLKKTNLIVKGPQELNAEKLRQL